MKVNILGTIYTVKELPRQKDPFLEKCNGYCDVSSKKIVIITEGPDSELENFPAYRNKILRHEIIHAFLMESGLQENFHHDEYGHDETYVDWFAAQYPKIKKAFQMAGCDE